MVVAAEIHTATHFCAWKIVIPTATCPLAFTFASFIAAAGAGGFKHLTGAQWCLVVSNSQPQSNGDGGRGWLSPAILQIIANVLVEYAVLVNHLLVEDSPPQLLGWSTNTTETRSLWCILYNTNFSRGGNFCYIREFGFCAKCSSREIFLPRNFPPREN